ncbi:sigma-54 interaction domain-containing protein [Polymorphobacter fuscus]|uniref:AAA domain-containing protein n=1 Tax=Sandarakinorhabdus fusca TaxID=1439888 RepID=A0A7C9KW13_9SPHN|nr:sigma-54 dependent transcriptional regulator [Polymorphobacter fuscus]KAB7649021.1 sigma-54-dependent Fis family transcriptional regulator [Polymorphobacter fuscus]MQT16625.1 AAA domain-containing protein [Polymorphobacter fuscus]NJC07085.1 DNA-binding NtrC family response regulator [Polymorphobacter fuscus]
MKTRHGTFPTQLATLVGNSNAIANIRNEIETLADSHASVLITGPSGSGKDVVAQLLHQRSRRAAHPFVALNCAAVAPDLLESEMFGHEAGAFTGALKARAGRFEAAHGGTLFLDEVGDMPLAMQAKLLRALETRVVERVGSMLPIAVDVRLCAATSINLFAAIDRGAFRSDLLYRLDVIRLVMPALADRPEDIPLLVAHFTAQLPGPAVTFDDDALALLMAQPWPGNVRELKNFVERAQAHHPGGRIDADRATRLLHRDSPTTPRRTTPPPPPPPLPSMLPAGNIDLKTILSSMEQAYIVEALQASGGAIAASAKRLGLQRTTLIEKMRRLHIPPHGQA